MDVEGQMFSGDCDGLCKLNQGVRQRRSSKRSGVWRLLFDIIVFDISQRRMAGGMITK